jgi:hypothetical protein
MIQRLIDCARREVAMRRAVYPRRVEAGKMTQAKADEETYLMGQIVQTLTVVQGWIGKQEADADAEQWRDYQAEQDREDTRR